LLERADATVHFFFARVPCATSFHAPAATVPAFEIVVVVVDPFPELELLLQAVNTQAAINIHFGHDIGAPA
jgi:hypothetical protein